MADSIRAAQQVGQMRDRIDSLEADVHRLEAALTVVRQQLVSRDRQIAEISRERDGYAMGLDELRRTVDNAISEVHMRNGTIVRVTTSQAELGPPPVGGGL